MNSKHKKNYNKVAQEESEATLTLITTRPRLNHLLRSRCRLFLIIFTVFAMAIVIRSGISASRGYALVATQEQAQQIEMENERLRVEIAKLKSFRAKCISRTTDDRQKKNSFKLKGSKEFFYAKIFNGGGFCKEPNLQVS